jgi:diguanylate cyclase
MFDRREQGGPIDAHLVAAGYKLERATTAREALTILAGGTCDAVLATAENPQELLDILAAATEGGCFCELVLLREPLTPPPASPEAALELRAYACLDLAPQPAAALIVVDRAIEKKRLREENARLRLELAEKRPRQDAGLSRHALDSALAREVARARRHDTSLGVVLLGLDNLDALLDRFGPRGLEAAMGAFARAASSELRESDLLFLDESRTLVALLPHAEVSGAMKAAERIARAAATAGARVGSEALGLVASAGVAALEPSDADGQSLLTRARAALRESGRSGQALVYASGAPLAAPWRRVARWLLGSDGDAWMPEGTRVH